MSVLGYSRHESFYKPLVFSLLYFGGVDAMAYINKSVVSTEYDCGEVVYDDLTGRTVRVVGIEHADPKERGDSDIKRPATSFIVVDNDYLYGLRWPWELTKYD